MRARIARSFVAAAVIAAGFSVAAPAEATSNKVVLMKAIRALNRGDVAAYAGFFTPNGVFAEPGMTVRGRAAIIRHERESAAEGIRVFIYGLKGDGDTVNGQFSVTSKGMRQAGFRRFLGFFTARFTGNQIRHLSIRPDLSDPDTKKIIEMEV